MDRVTRWCGIALLGSIARLRLAGPGLARSSLRSARRSRAEHQSSKRLPVGDVGSQVPRRRPRESLPSAATPPPDGEAASAPSSEAIRRPLKRNAPGRSTGAAAAPPPEQLQSWAAALAAMMFQAREAATEKLHQVAAAGPQPLLPLLQDASPDVRRGTVVLFARPL